jgi:hypothetical protein
MKSLIIRDFNFLLQLFTFESVNWCIAIEKAMDFLKRESTAFLLLVSKLNRRFEESYKLQFKFDYIHL